MFDNTRLKSPSQGGSRKVYDYLNPDQQISGSISKDRFLSGSKPRIVHDLSPIQKQQTQYQLIVQFQLRRQKQKNVILQQRLRNKQSFIKQMKQFQDQLTIAFEKCQQQLHYYKSQCQQYQSRWNSFATFNNGILQNNSVLNVNNVGVNNSSGGIVDYNTVVAANHNINNSSLLASNINNNNNNVTSPVIITQQLIRQYVQQIAELKHLVIRLEEEINYYQKRQKTYGNNNRYMSSSVKNQFFPNRGEGSRVVGEVEENEGDGSRLGSPNKKITKGKGKAIKNDNNNKSKKHYKPLESDKKQQRSKTLANQFVEQKKQQNFTTLNKISQFINTQTRKISSFINHFLTMCEFFQQSIEKQPSIKHKLKKAWKWVKTAIAEWNYLKKEKIQKIKEYKIGNIVTKLLPQLANLSIDEIETLLQKILTKPPGQQQQYYSKSSSNNLY